VARLVAGIHDYSRPSWMADDELARRRTDRSA
jgi:hypothetical protein